LIAITPLARLRSPDPSTVSWNQTFTGTAHVLVTCLAAGTYNVTGGCALNCSNQMRGSVVDRRHAAVIRVQIGIAHQRHANHNRRDAAVSVREGCRDPFLAVPDGGRTLCGRFLSLTGSVDDPH
jgi:hypothetical protein